MKGREKMQTYCPHCNGVFEVDAEFTGATVECGACGREFVVEEVVIIAPQEEAAAPQSALGPSAAATIQLAASAEPVSIPKPQPKGLPQARVAEGGRMVERIVGNSVPCKECGNSISRFAIFCPKCGVGYHNDRVVTAKLSGKALLVVAMIAILSAVIGGVLAYSFSKM